MRSPYYSFTTLELRKEKIQGARRNGTIQFNSGILFLALIIGVLPRIGEKEKLSSIELRILLRYQLFLLHLGKVVNFSDICGRI